ncbi:MAG: hypothetical protein ABII90_09870, partial [Bacteroidota bacterium]
EQALQNKISEAKNIFLKNLTSYINDHNGFPAGDKENKITSLRAQMEQIIDALPKSAPPDIVFTELAKYKIEEVVEKLESGREEEVTEKAQKIYDDLYAGLIDGCYSIKYANENEKYNLNMS